MMQDDMMSSASSSASASASPSASAMMSASASALPKTGGTSLLPLLSAAVLAVMVGSGLVAARLVRSNS
jgi:LPXTG-motif cell wall-anchored protein